MHWFVISGCGEIVFDCPDDEKGEDRIIEYMAKNYWEETGEDVEYALIIRGERKQFVPPREMGALVSCKPNLCS